MSTKKESKPTQTDKRDDFLLALAAVVDNESAENRDAVKEAARKLLKK